MGLVLSAAILQFLYIFSRQFIQVFGCISVIFVVKHLRYIGWHCIYFIGMAMDVSVEWIKDNFSFVLVVFTAVVYFGQLLAFLFGPLAFVIGLC